MIHKTKKGTLFLLGILVTGLISIISSQTRTNLSKESSLFSTAHADTPGPSCGWCGCPWTDSQCTNYYNAGGDSGACASADSCCADSSAS